MTDHFVWVVAGLLATFLVWGTLAPFRRARLERQKQCADRFFEKAGALAAARDTPVMVLGVLQFLNQRLWRPGEEWRLLAVLARRNGDKARAHDPLASFRTERPELYRLFGEACVAGIQAMSYRGNPLAGWVIRHFVLFSPRNNGPGAVDLVVMRRAQATA